MADQAHERIPTWLIAIDIGKKAHAVLVEGPEGTRQHFSMANSVKDYDRLVVFLRALPGAAQIALEPTGDFHRTLAHRLLREGFPVPGGHVQLVGQERLQGCHGHPAPAQSLSPL